VLTTDQKGAVAELAIAHAAAQLGVGVFKPLTDGERYDLIFDFRPRLMRVQCKTAVQLRRSVLKVACYSARRTGDGLVKRYYSASEIDAIAAYSTDLERCYFIPIDEIPGRSEVLLRFEPCRNNQRRGVNWAGDFELSARLRALLGP
jgi:PD-(D/E)XK endonuclease